MSQGIAQAAHARTIDYADAGTTFEGYAVIPQPEGTERPCVVLAHDWSGLTDPTKRLAERYADLGYVCFALDLYGKGVRGDPVTRSGADRQLHAYGHALHAFTFERANFPERGLLYDRKADERSWAAMRAHLATVLGE